MKKVEYLIYPFIALWVISIIWINFHCSQWYQMDAYGTALLGRLISESKSFFPPDWIFSSAYYIIGSPNISAIFYSFMHDSVKAMSFASTVNVIIILLSFYWCFHGTIGKKAMAAGLLCMAGGIIFGTSAIRYISGLQVLLTLCSYYACYLIVLLLTVGCWLRIKAGKTSWLMIGLTIILSFALGMHSLRALLVINIPLLLLELLLLFTKNGLSHSPGRSRDLRPLYFVIAVFLASLGGMALVSSLDIPATPVIEPVQLDLSPSGIAAHFWASSKNILRISGIAIASDGMKYLPLSVCGLLIALIIVWAVVHMIKTKDFGPLPQVIVVSLFSLFGVFFVGVFLMRTRDIYYFVYWFLAAASIVYAFECLKKEYHFPLACVLVVVSLVNYYYNFIPDFKDYRKNAEIVQTFTQSLLDRGVHVIYSDATPIFAATSHDAILSQSFWLDTDLESGYPLTVFPSDKYIKAFDDSHYDGALICFSNYTLRFIESEEGKDFREQLMDQLEPYDEFSINNSRYLFFKPKDGRRVIQPL